MERNRKLFLGKVAAIMGALPLLIWAYEYGPNPGYVQVPGENGGASCAAGTQGGTQCHATSASSFTTGSVTVNFPNGQTYTPGVKQHLSVTIADSNPSLKGWGFQLTARSGSPATTMAGTFTSSDANTLLMCSQTNLFIYQAVNYSPTGSQTCPSNEPLEYIEHSLAGFTATIGSGPVTYQFDWTPPASDVGNIVIYVAGNAGLGEPAVVTGDHVYTAKYTLTSAAAGAPPSIFSGGVISAGSFGAFSTIAPGTWIEIYGNNLGPASGVTWSGSDFNNNIGPTSLAGVSVTIGGQPAYLDYVSSGQIDAQVPSNIGTGSQNIVVTTAAGAGAPYAINVNATQPGLDAPPSFTVNGKQYVVALHPDTSPCGTPSGLCYVLPANAISGLASAPAKAGETITLYGVGFGNVNPSFPAGQIVTASNSLTLPLLVNFGSTPASVSCSTCYDGLAPNYVGLYQFNVLVPSVSSSSTVPFSFTLGGVAGSQTLYTAVQ
jgi:uncharacterized protein (TIGR03437 family)